MNINELSKTLIDRYWSEFRAGKTWNYYSWKPKYLQRDTWASQEKWLSVSKECIEANTNVVQALEVLLDLEYENYIEKAQEIVRDWYNSGAYDSYYYFDIIAKFPQDHPIRKDILSIDKFEDIYSENSEVSMARKALIFGKDESFIESSSEYVNQLLAQPFLNIEIIESRIIPILLDFGDLSKEYLSIERLDQLKYICLEYFEKDKDIIDRFLNGKPLEENTRNIWVGDDLAYWAWTLGWDDVLSILDSEDIYWSAIFSDFWDDYDNNNLLIWSLQKDDPLIQNRAIWVMNTHELYKLDGAIAWSRLAVGWGSILGS
ncbi:hypothetical protein [Cyanothece sp. BG0011]|uniref:hypothetical protein n=1 Tax=Cyanothece sp. BG0011 TaxID=2082950 RepID=UPI0013001D2F